MQKKDRKNIKKFTMIHYFITFYRTNNVINQYSIALTILGSLLILYTMSNKKQLGYIICFSSYMFFSNIGSCVCKQYEFQR